MLTGTQTPDKTRRIKYIFFFFFCQGREEGRGELFSRNNDLLALGESQPSLAVVLQSTAGPGKLTQRIFNEVVAYVRDLFTWNMEATDLNGTVCIEMGLGSILW